MAIPSQFGGDSHDAIEFMRRVTERSHPRRGEERRQDQRPRVIFIRTPFSGRPATTTRTTPAAGRDSTLCSRAGARGRRARRGDRGLAPRTPPKYGQ
ncbi:hypothetical protein EVAR_4087_1 [Eumeta japonica]|uniref:Uncharacterized protein n=1 Tax=Eumeta variegata TaxID=151549 RepID=A0A4C1T495_EUMVA|nr:hypothetical protein EVAR_4087_1 [Eumeta japonica]